MSVSDNPDGVAITPEGAFVYVANFLAGIVSVIEAASNTVVATVSVGSTRFGVAVTPDGAFTYVAAFMANTVVVIETAFNTVVATVTTALHP